jgi:DNA-binding beta-propeller fold protein YncE
VISRVRRIGRYARVVFVVAAALIASSCEQSVTAPVGAFVLSAEWTPPTGTPTVGSLASVALAVRVVDSQGEPAAGIVVGFADLLGRGTMSERTATTGADGRASVTWILGRQAGLQKATAFFRTVADSQRVQFELTLAPGSAVSMSVTTTDSVFSIGETASTIAVFRDADSNVTAAPGPIAYSSSRVDVATVSNAGIISALAPGLASMFVSSGTLRDTVPLGVRANAPVPTISVQALDGTKHSIAFTPSRVALLPGFFEPVIRRFDAVSMVELPSIDLPVPVWDIALRPGSTQAVLTVDGPSLLIVDYAADSVLRSIALPSQAMQIRVSPDGAFAYVTLQNGNLARVNLTSDVIEDQLLATAVTTGLVLSSNGAFLFVSALDGGIWRVETSTMTVTRVAYVVQNVQGIALSADEKRLALATFGPAGLTSISADSLTDARSSSILQGAYDVIADPTGPRFVATGLNSATIVFVDEATMETLLTVDAVSDGKRLAREPGTTNLWFGNLAYGILVRIAFP